MYKLIRNHKGNGFGNHCISYAFDFYREQCKEFDDYGPTKVTFEQVFEQHIYKIVRIMLIK
jgi:hypothetical protein